MLERVAFLRIAAALLAAGLCARAADAAVLSLDFNARTSADAADTQGGFTAFTLDDSGSTVNGVKVSLSAIGAGTSLDDRDRTRPANGGAFTTSEILDDFVFAQTTSNFPSNGMDIRLEGLVPSTPYSISLFAYDSDSPGTRTATWTGNGTPLFTTSFEGTYSVAPGSDLVNRYDATALSDAAGTLTLSGRRSAGNPAVFADGLVVGVTPEPSSIATILGLGACLLRRRRTPRRTSVA
jgi:hypothetical protein